MPRARAGRMGKPCRWPARSAVRKPKPRVGHGRPRDRFRWPISVRFSNEWYGNNLSDRGTFVTPSTPPETQTPGVRSHDKTRPLSLVAARRRRRSMAWPSGPRTEGRRTIRMSGGVDRIVVPPNSPCIMARVVAASGCPEARSLSAPAVAHRLRHRAPGRRGAVVERKLRCLSHEQQRTPVEQTLSLVLLRPRPRDSTKLLKPPLKQLRPAVGHLLVRQIVPPAASSVEHPCQIPAQFPS